MCIFSLFFTATVLVAAINGVVSLEKSIAEFVAGTAQGSVLCNNEEFRDALYIMGGYFGYECYSIDNGLTFEMTFTQCLLERNQTHFTAISDANVVAISGRVEYNGPKDGDMHRLCQYIVNHTPVRSITGAITDTLDLWLGDYPNGVYNVVSIELTGGTMKFKYSPVNLLGVGDPTDRPNDPNLRLSNPCSDDSSFLFNQSYFLRGAELYGCIKGQTTPQFIGCCRPQLMRSNFSGGATIDCLVLYQVDDKAQMEMLRGLYAYQGFKSARRPIQSEIGKMTRMQLCARLAADLYDIVDDVNVPFRYTPLYSLNRPIEFLHRFPISWT